MTNDLKWMLSSDQQIPYQDDRMLDLWFAVMKWFKPDVVDYLGDTSDQACFARFSEGKTAEFLNQIKKNNVEDMFPFVESEEKPARDFYARTRELLPKAQLFSALGNHDIRVFNYLDVKIPDILAQATPETLWGLDSLGYDYIHYNDVPIRRFGDIFVHHGISISKHAGESVRNDVTDLGVSLIRGHSHRMGTFFKTMELRNEILRGYEIGHSCDETHPIFKYSQVHNWQKGFAIAHIENGEWPHISLIEVSKDYVCYVDGKRFSA